MSKVASDLTKIQPSLRELDGKEDPIKPPVETPPAGDPGDTGDSGSADPSAEPKPPSKERVDNPLLDGDDSNESEESEENEGTDQSGDEGQTGDDTESEMAYWEAVNKLYGTEIVKEIPPEVLEHGATSPEATLYIIQQQREAAIEQFEAELERRNPKGYAYLLHSEKGGSDEEFFQEKTQALPDFESFKNDVVSQQAFYKRSLIDKGMDPEDAEELVKSTIAKGTLWQKAEKEWKAVEAKNLKLLEDTKRASDAAEAEYNASVTSLSKKLQSHILENKGLGITIPDTKRTAFLEYLSNLVVYDRGTKTFSINQAITQEDMPKMIESLYYQFVGGNLADIIQRKSQEKVMNRLKLSMNSNKRKSASGPDNIKTDSNQKPGVNKAIREL